MCGYKIFDINLCGIFSHQSIHFAFAPAWMRTVMVSFLIIDNVYPAWMLAHLNTSSVL
jgi:hypothetical protein